MFTLIISRLHPNELSTFNSHLSSFNPFPERRRSTGASGQRHHPERMEIIQPRVARNELPWENVPEHPNSERVASQPQSSRRDPQLESKLRRFFFEQRARVLASLGQAGCQPPSSTTHRSSSNPLFDALPDPEHAAALVLQPQLTPEDTAALRQRLTTETQTLREAVAASLEEGLRQGHDREQLAAGVRAIYNQAICHVVERIEQL